MSAFTFIVLYIQCIFLCVSALKDVCPSVAVCWSLLHLFSLNITLSQCKPLPVQVTAKNPPQCCELGTGLLDTWSHDVGLVDWSLQSCYYNSWDVIQAPPLLSAGACGSSSENYLTPSCLRSGRQCCGSEWNSQHQLEMLPPCCAEPTNPAFNPMCELPWWLHELTSEKRS